MSLSDSDLKYVEEAITGPKGPELMRLMERITSYGRPNGDFSDEVLDLAFSLGWMSEKAYPTDLGWEIGDPIREFLYWNRRDRRVHYWYELPVMRPEYFEGKDLLSVGCGCGTNLLTFQSMCRSVTGIEVVSTYLQFTPIWARLAGVETPKTMNGIAEDLPFEDEAFVERLRSIHQTLGTLGEQVAQLPPVFGGDQQPPRVMSCGDCDGVPAVDWPGCMIALVGCQASEITRLEGARHIPIGDLEQRIGELDPDTPVVVYCKMGGRGARAVRLLVEHGFRHVTNLAGGLDRWSEEIDPTMPRY